MGWRSVAIGLFFFRTLASCQSDQLLPAHSATVADNAYEALIEQAKLLNIDGPAAVSERFGVTLRPRSESPYYRFWTGSVPHDTTGVENITIDYRQRIAAPPGGNILVLDFPSGTYRLSDALRDYPGLTLFAAPNGHSPHESWVYVIPGTRNEVRLGFDASDSAYLRSIYVQTRNSL